MRATCRRRYARRTLVTRALAEQLGALAQTLREGSTFQFEGSTLTLAYEALPLSEGREGTPVAVWLDDFERPCMTRDPEFNVSYLATVEAIAAAVA